VVIRQLFFAKGSPIKVFTERNNLALVPGHLNQWFGRDFDSKFGVLDCCRGLEGISVKIMQLLLLKIKSLHCISGQGGSR